MSRRMLARPVSRPLQKTVDHFLPARLVEVDRQLVALDLGDVAVAELLVEHAVAHRIGRRAVRHRLGDEFALDRQPLPKMVSRCLQDL